ncbi:hypothetical protein ESCO_002662 [Escovopsis weberi]|uniref:Cupin type-2 domain-containing protein n=1 Tax=Escovopsis weberi TaxID=150374 RepID=A0A0M8N0V5_ESCWE|nr:hypothetical protein ESCO_002662 [Escovopsis weberi]
MAAAPKDQTVSGLDNVTVHITGHNEEGKEYFVSSDKAQWVGFHENAIGMSVLYTTDFGANLNDDEDIKKHREKMATRAVGLVNPNGTLFRMVDFAPGTPALMHCTKSLDYGIIISGSLEAVLPSGEKVIMKPGDVCVQRGTGHGWRNCSDTEWARVCFILQDIKPVVVNGKTMGEDFYGQESDVPPSGNDP